VPNFKLKMRFYIVDYLDDGVLTTEATNGGHCLEDKFMVSESSCHRCMEFATNRRFDGRISI